MVKETKNLSEENISNGAEALINFQQPYLAYVEIELVADYLFHRWNCESVEMKATAAKGSRAKKTDDLESYVYRNSKGELCIPGEQLRMSIVTAAKFKQDPRSPRKSAMDLYKAGIVSLTPLASTGKKNWDYEDKRRVVIQRNSISRIRPALSAGQKVKFTLQVNVPEYIKPQDLNDTIVKAGLLQGLGDFRPSFGRFMVTEFKVLQLE